MTQTNTEKVRDILEQATAFTIAAVGLIVIVLLALGLFLGSLQALTWALDPVVPDGWPSYIILALAIIPPLFFGGVVAASVDRLSEVDDE